MLQTGPRDVEEEALVLYVIIDNLVGNGNGTLSKKEIKKFLELNELPKKEIKEIMKAITEFLGEGN